MRSVRDPEFLFQERHGESTGLKILYPFRKMSTYVRQTCVVLLTGGEGPKTCPPPGLVERLQALWGAWRLPCSGRRLPWADVLRVDDPGTGWAPRP